ncbi:alanine--tRNA ligase [archaeon]|nr:alanine--tRNA ligase [archaeon]
MVNEKELKKELETKTRKNPDAYYPTKVLKSLGFKRGECSECGIMFWSKKKRGVCGEPACIGGYEFINQPLKKKLDFIQSWNSFSSFMKKRGYTPIKRYPVVARWRNDVFFVPFSIADFQPYVVNGLVEPPANPLVVPQLCVRFNDIDNIGLSGRHGTCFVMVGQHAFTSLKDFKQDKYFKDLVEWFLSIGVKPEDLIFHEDQWSGGGNMGVSIEFFTKGLELCNQVYMRYNVTPEGLKPLKLNVLDMGLGLARIPWLATGSNTMYEAIYPSVMKKLFKITGVKVPGFYKDFLPYSGLLNTDEVDMEEAWTTIGNKIGVEPAELKESIMPLAALFSIADHARTLLVTIADGAVPSNTGGGYNIRLLFRRAYNFIKDYEWSINLVDVCEWHAEYLKPLFPELIKAMPQVNKIINHEEKKFLKTRKKWKRLINELLNKGARVSDLLMAYDSHGIPPERVKRAGEEKGVRVVIPDDFYTRLNELHEQEEEQRLEDKRLLKTSDLPAVKRLCYRDLTGFNARVLRVKGKCVVLNQTAFYPTSGGQLHDTGELGGVKVVNVISQGSQIVHVLAAEPRFKKGDMVKGLINKDRRQDLMRNHTATHIINGVARRVLGEHVWQAGSKVGPAKARLDITHYKRITPEELNRIEAEANKVVKKGVSVGKREMKRGEAELEFGFRLYQGGDVPRKRIRVVDIRDTDIEACGGTHVSNTRDIGLIKIIKCSKIQDGVVRLEYVTGDYARDYVAKRESIVKEVEELLGAPVECSVNELAGVFSVQPRHLIKTINRFIKEAKGFGAPDKELIKGGNALQALQHLFDTWKKYRKLSKKGQ